MSERLTLQDLVDLLSEEQGITKKDAENFIRELVDLTTETIAQKDFVRMKDFGTFKLTPVKARKSVDVNTGEAIEISAHYKLSFTPDKVLREAVNRPFSHFESILVEEDVVFEDKAQEAPKKKALKEQPKEKEQPVAAVVEKVVPVAADIVEEVVVENKTVEPVVVEPQVADKADTQGEKEPVAVEKEEIVLDTSQEEEIEPEIVDKAEESPQASPLSSAEVEPEPVEEKIERKLIQDNDDDDDDWDDSYEEEKKKRNIRIGIGVLVAVLLIIGYWGYTSYGVQEQVDIPVAQDNSGITISDSGDSGDAIVEDTGAAEASTQEPETNENTQQPEGSSRLAENVQGGVEVEVQAGQTMRMLGEKYFGNRAFWVYIFEENREIISRPDAIFAGMKIMIPLASKYDIDPDDRTSVRKAERLEMKLFGEFSDR